MSRERRDERVARDLREQIYAGHPAPGEALPSSDIVAARYGISGAMAQRAFDLLREEGLVRSEQGRGTFVCERHLYTAEVTGTAAGRTPGTRQLAEARRSEPAVTGLTVTDDDGKRTWVMTVEVAAAGPAAITALAVARLLGGSHSGWQLAVTVTPAADT